MKNNKSLYITIPIILILIGIIIFLLNKPVETKEVTTTSDNDELSSLVEQKEEKITELETQVETLQNEKSTLETKVSNLENKINNTTDETECEDLTELKETYEKKIKTLNNKITNLNNKITKIKNTFTVFYSVNDKTIYKETVYKGNNVKNVPTAPDYKDYHVEWSSNGKNIQSDTVIYAKYYYEVTFEITEEDSDPIATLSKDTLKVYRYNQTLTFDDDGIKLDGEYVLTASLKEEYPIYNYFYWYIGHWTQDYDADYILDDGVEYEVTSDMLLTYYGTYACIAKGSKISTPTGTTNVEDIRPGDIVLAYDMYTGTISEKEVFTNIKGTHEARVFTLTLENGNKIQIVDEENVFDTDAKKYKSINITTYKDMVGTNIMINNNGQIAYSKIKSITLEEKEIEHYSMYTKDAINYIANDIVLLPSTVGVNFPLYTVLDDYKIDYDLLNHNRELYGVYTYEEFKDVCTKEVFDGYHIEDYKTLVEKGIISYDKLKSVIKLFQEELDYTRSLYK